MAFGSEVLVEKKFLSELQKKALRSYIMKKNKKELEDKTFSAKNQSGTSDACNDDCDDASHGSPGSKRSHSQSQGNQESVVSSVDTTYGTPVKAKDESIGTVTEQLKSLREKLEGLRKEKHQLFQELKKVLHEEDEKKRQQQLEQQKLCQNEQDSLPSYSQSMTEGGMVMYRGDPRLGKVAMKHSWTAYSSSELLPPSKLPRSSSLQEMSHYTQPQPQQQQQPPPPPPSTYTTHPSAEQDKYTPPSYLQRIPSQGHMVRPHVMSPGLTPGYHQFRGGHYGGYSPSNTSQYGSHPPYQGVLPRGGYIQSPGPHPPPDAMQGQMYHPPHQQQYMSQQMVHPHDFSPQSQFSFEPHQSRFMIRGQRPPIKMGPFSPQHDQVSSPSQSPLPPADRMRYMQRQKNKL